MGGFLSSVAKIADRFGSSSENVRSRIPGLSQVGSSLIGRIYYSTQAGVILAAGQSGPWRPSQWGRSVPLTLSATDSQSGKATIYIFDAILRAEHHQASVVTLNPVQTGAAISDHAYTLPARLTVEIAMSDAMQSYDVNQWNNGPTRSISAYQTLLALQRDRKIIQVSTALRQYDKMLVAEIRAEQTKETTYGLKALVTFIEILTASVEVTSSTISYNSALPQTTAESLIGQAATAPVPANILSQNSISKLLSPGSISQSLGSINTPVGKVAGLASSIPGAGQWSSTISGLTSSLGAR